MKCRCRSIRVRWNHYRRTSSTSGIRFTYCCCVADVWKRPRAAFGALAQLGEHRLCKAGVVGSIPTRSTPRIRKADAEMHRPFCFCRRGARYAACDASLSADSAKRTRRPPRARVQIGEARGVQQGRQLALRQRVTEIEPLLLKTLKANQTLRLLRALDTLRD